MTKFRDYKDYVSDPTLARKYSDYQGKYADNPRESDKKTARLVLEALRGVRIVDRAPRILDIGCSTGNFLRHLKRLMPDADLTGGDLMEATLQQCRAAPDLQGIKFEKMDILNLSVATPFDVVVVNAVTYLFDPDVFQQSCRSLRGALRPGGIYTGYELIFPGDREEVVHEAPSDWNPQGFRLMLRSETFVRRCLTEAGFSSVEIEPFDIPIDLPMPDPNNTENDASLVTYTKRDSITNRRLMYRGPLFQPWAHIVAQRSA